MKKDTLAITPVGSVEPRGECKGELLMASDEVEVASEETEETFICCCLAYNCCCYNAVTSDGASCEACQNGNHTECEDEDDE